MTSLERRGGVRTEEGRRKKGTGRDHVRLQVEQYGFKHSSRIVWVLVLVGVTLLCLLFLTKLRNPHTTFYHHILADFFIMLISLAPQSQETHSIVIKIHSLWQILDMLWCIFILAIFRLMMYSGVLFLATNSTKYSIFNNYSLKSRWIVAEYLPSREAAR